MKGLSNDLPSLPDLLPMKICLHTDYHNQSHSKKLQEHFQNEMMLEIGISL